MVELGIFYLETMRVGVAWAGSDSVRQREPPNYMFLDWKGQKVRRTSRWQLWGPEAALLTCIWMQTCTSLQSSISLSISPELLLWSWLLSHTRNSVFSQRRVSFSLFYFFTPFLPWVEPSYFHFFLPIPSFFLPPILSLLTFVIQPLCIKYWG